MIQQIQDPDPDPSPTTSRHLVPAGLELAELGPVWSLRLSPVNRSREVFYLLERSRHKVSTMPRIAKASEITANHGFNVSSERLFGIASMLSTSLCNVAINAPLRQEPV